METTKETKKSKSKPVVTDKIRQQVEGTTPSTPKSQELQSIQQRAEQQMAKPRVVSSGIKQQVEGTTPSTKQAELSAIQKRAAMSQPVVTEAVKKAMQGDTGNSQQSQELDSVMQRTIRNMPVVTDRVRQAVEGTDTSTQQSQELQMIQDRTARALEAQKAVATSGSGNVGSANANAGAGAGAGGSTSTSSSTNPSTSTIPYGFLDEYLERMQPTPEELEAERKRERRKAIFNAIGDGVSSLANLYFTTKGAPNSYNPADNMTRKQRERYEKLLAERKADEEKYFNAKLKLDQMRENANWRNQTREDQIYQFNQTNERLREQAQATEARLFEQFRQQQEANNAKAKAEQANKAMQNAIREKELEEKNRHNTAAEAETVRYHDQLVERAQNKASGTGSKKRAVASWAGKGTKGSNKIEF